MINQMNLQCKNKNEKILIQKSMSSVGDISYDIFMIEKSFTINYLLLILQNITLKAN